MSLALTGSILIPFLFVCSYLVSASSPECKLYGSGINSYPRPQLFSNRLQFPGTSLVSQNITWFLLFPFPTPADTTRALGWQFVFITISGVKGVLSPNFATYCSREFGYAIYLLFQCAVLETSQIPSSLQLPFHPQFFESFQEFCFLRGSLSLWLGIP